MSIVAISGCTAEQLTQEAFIPLPKEQSLSQPASPHSYHSTSLSQAPCIPIPPQPCSFIGWLLQNAYVAVQPIFSAILAPVAYLPVPTQAGGITMAPPYPMAHAQISTSLQSVDSQPIITSASAYLALGECAAQNDSSSEEEWVAILMNAVANRAQYNDEAIKALIDDAQKHSFSEAQYLQILDLILQLSPSQHSIKYHFLQNVAIAATHAMSSLGLHDYINLAKIFFYSRLKKIIADHPLRTALDLWGAHFQPLLHKQPTLTAADSIILLCFTHKYHIHLAQTSIAHLSNIIEQDFEHLALGEVKNLFWLYNQTTNISPKILELMYAILTSDLHQWDKQKDEKDISDIFFILIAGAKLKWEIDKSADAPLVTDLGSQEKQFIAWLQKMKVYPLVQVRDSLLSIMYPNREKSISHSLQTSRKKKKKAQTPQTEREKNDWDLLEAAEAQALSDLQAGIQFVKHREQESYKVQQLIDKIYLFRARQQSYDQLLDRAIQAGSIEALFIKGEDLAKQGALAAAMNYYYTAHKHRHPEAAYKCAIACKRKAEEEIAKNGARNEVNSWYRKSINFYRDAIILYLTDDTIATRIDGSGVEYLYEFFYNTALVAAALDEVRLAAFCLYAILEISPQVATNRAKGKLTIYRMNKEKTQEKASQKTFQASPKDSIKRAQLEESVTMFQAKNEISKDIQYLINKLKKRFYSEE